MMKYQNEQLDYIIFVKVPSEAKKIVAAARSYPEAINIYEIIRSMYTVLDEISLYNRKTRCTIKIS